MNNALNHGFSNLISPLDGRYYHKIKIISQYFSEMTLNKNRVKVELNYLKQLSYFKVIRKLTKKEKILIDNLVNHFNQKDNNQIRKIERKINHDVKAVEYYLKETLSKTTMRDIISYLHLGLTSEDINNLAYSLMLTNVKKNLLENKLSEIIKHLIKMSRKYVEIPLLGRTHGQPAVPTTIGKEMANYVYRLEKQLKRIKQFQFEGKCNGAVGNFNALKVNFPSKDWIMFSKNFIKTLGLIPNLYTTQILYYDNWIEFFQIVKLINGILIDFSINIWIYIMLGVFKQSINKKEIGSSTMPQKVNPIHFEQAEGSLGIANTIIEFFERKLIHSRLQRDLSDSIVRRIFSEVFGYTLLSWKNILEGLSKINPNKEYLTKELNCHWEILTEAIQIFLRIKGEVDAFEKIKKLSQGKQMRQKDFLKLLKKLDIIQSHLGDLAPETYIGEAKKLVNQLSVDI